MTQEKLLEIAMKQSAIDLNCDAKDFCRNENRIVFSKKHPKARKYLALPFYCNLVSYGSNIVASVSPETEAVVRAYLGKVPIEHCFETPNLYVLNEGLEKLGLRVCWMAEYFLPDLSQLHAITCAYEMRLLGPADFAELYQPEWCNALCEQRKQLDMLAVGAYDGEKLVGLAGCSADCEEMWQIGVDVCPEYRRQGIASALTAQLTMEILQREKVPFYCTAWANLRSVRNALRCGFRPVWVELTAKKKNL